MKVENKSPLELLGALAGAGGTEKAEKGFQQLLSTVMQGLGNKKAETPDDATLGAAASQIAQSTPQPAAEQPAEGGGEMADHTVAATPGLAQAAEAAAVEMAETATETGEILTMQFSLIPEEGEEAMMARTTFPPLLDTDTGDKLGDMVGQAQQELLQLVELNQAGEPTEPLPDVVVPEEIPEEVVAEEIIPEEPETLPEEPVMEQPTDTQEGSARVSSQPETPRSELHSMTELPHKDRLVMEMRETREAERKPEPAAETAAVEQKPEPAAPQAERAPEPDIPRPPQGMDQMEQVRVEVTRNLDQQNMEFRMQLQPEHLGKVDVKMVLESGRLMVEILASTPKAAELLAKHAEGLILSLRSQDIDVHSVNVVTETQTAQGHMDGAFNMSSGQGEDAGGQGTKSGLGRGQGAADSQGEEPEAPERSPEVLLDRVI